MVACKLARKIARKEKKQEKKVRKTHEKATKRVAAEKEAAEEAAVEKVAAEKEAIEKEAIEKAVAEKDAIEKEAIEKAVAEKEEIFNNKQDRLRAARILDFAATPTANAFSVLKMPSECDVLARMTPSECASLASMSLSGLETGLHRGQFLVVRHRKLKTIIINMFVEAGFPKEQSVDIYQFCKMAYVQGKVWSLSGLKYFKNDPDMHIFLQLNTLAERMNEYVPLLAK